MSQLSAAVSIHPYFKVQEGKLAEFQELMKDFVAKTEGEERCLYYDFFVLASENQVYCREAYIGAEGVLTHLSNVEECIGKALEISELFRLEIVGPEEELANLREPLKDLKPDFYARAAGVAAK